MRRALTVKHVSAIQRPAVVDAFQAAKRFIGFGFCEADFDASLVAGSLLQLMRSSHADDFAVVNDGDAVAEALGLFDIVRGEDDGFFLAL